MAALSLSEAAGAIVVMHGVGGQKDLPISLSLTIAGAVAALVVSFTVLAVAWREPRYDEPRGAPNPEWLTSVVDSTGWRVTLRVVGMVLFGYTVVAAVFGENLEINPLPGLFFVVLWVGLVFASALLGPVWKAISPARTINLAFTRLTGGDPGRGMYDYPDRLGYWPGAIALYAFVWFELVYSHPTEIPSIRLWIALWVAVMLIGGALFGDEWLERADPFEVFSTLVGRLSPWGRQDGALVLRSPLANLATITPTPGLIAVVAVLFGSTGFDSFRESSGFVQLKQSVAYPWLLQNAGLLAFCVAAGVIFAVGSAATGVGPGTSRRSLPDVFAHSIVPIILGYFVAHYLTYFVEIGQRTLIYASDPLSTGADILGTGSMQISYWLQERQGLVANIKVLAVVAGHIVAAMAAHDRALTVLPRRHQLTGQLPLLAAMVAFTAGGLYLLFSS